MDKEEEFTDNMESIEKILGKESNDCNKQIPQNEPNSRRSTRPNRLSLYGHGGLFIDKLEQQQIMNEIKENNRRNTLPNIIIKKEKNDDVSLKSKKNTIILNKPPKPLKLKIKVETTTEKKSATKINNDFSVIKPINFKSKDKNNAKIDKIPKIQLTTEPEPMPKFPENYMTSKRRMPISKFAKNSDNTFSVTKQIGLLLTTKNENQEAYKDKKHELEIERINKELEDELPSWLPFLKEGFNIILYGLGSKISLLKSFAAYMEDYDLIGINGQFPNISPKDILEEFVKIIKDEEYDIKLKEIWKNVTNVEEKTLLLVNHLKTNKEIEPIFVLIKHFDVLASRRPQCLNLLCILAKLPFLHIIGSTDHVNAYTGIDSEKNRILNFIWKECNTFLSYTSNELITDVEKDTFSSVESASLERILNASTENSKKAFKIMTEMFLDTLDSSEKNKKFSAGGIEFRDLLKKCREKFIAYNEQSLKNLMTEFVDHNVIKISGGLITLMIDINSLQDSLESLSI